MDFMRTIFSAVKSWTKKEIQVKAAETLIEARKYDGSESGLSSTDVQGAIDELKILTESAQAGTDYSNYRLRNVAILNDMPETMNNGDIALVYQ